MSQTIDWPVVIFVGWVIGCGVFCGFMCWMTAKVWTRSC